MPLGAVVIARNATMALCMFALLTACRASSAEVPTAAATAAPTAAPTASLLPTPTGVPASPPARPQYQPSTETTIYISPSGWFTLTLPAPWILFAARAGDVNAADAAELTALHPDERSALTALLTITTTPAAGITLHQWVAAATGELQAQPNVTVEQSRVDLTYRLRNHPLGILDYVIAHTSAELTVAGRQYAIYIAQPKRYLLLTFTGTPAEMSALDQQMELITTLVQTVD